MAVLHLVFTAVLVALILSGPRDVAQAQALASAEPLPIEYVPQTGHAGRVTAMAYSDNARLLATASVDDTVRL